MKEIISGTREILKQRRVDRPEMKSLAIVVCLRLDDDDDEDGGIRAAALCNISRDILGSWRQREDHKKEKERERGESRRRASQTVRDE